MILRIPSSFPLQKTSHLLPHYHLCLFIRAAHHHVCSTSTSTDTTAPPPPSPPTPVDLRPKLSSPSLSHANAQRTGKKFSLRPYVFASACFVLGTLASKYLSYVIFPPAQPTPGSHEDSLLIESFQAQADRLPLVVSLQADPAWKAEVEHTRSGGDPDIGREMLMTGPLAGSRALGGCSRIFRNTHSNELLQVLWIGGAVTGWPGVVHGGCATTLLDEVMGLCAGGGRELVLDIDFRRPVLANGWFVLRANLLTGGKERDTQRKREWETEIEREPSRKTWVTGRLETLDGLICVEATGLYDIPAGK